MSDLDADARSRIYGALWSACEGIQGSLGRHIWRCNTACLGKSPIERPGPEVCLIAVGDAWTNLVMTATRSLMDVMVLA